LHLRIFFLKINFLYKFLYSNPIMSFSLVFGQERTRESNIIVAVTEADAYEKRCMSVLIALMWYSICPLYKSLTGKL